MSQLGEVAIELLARANDQFGSRGRRGGAHVGDEIGDSEISFMADAGDNRNRAGRHGPSDAFLVEGPEVFQRAAAARQDEHVGQLLAVEIFDGVDDFGGRAFALHAHGVQDQMKIGEAPAQDANDVAYGSSGRRSDEADAARQHGQRHFARGIEQAFFLEAALQLLEGQLQGARPTGSRCST